MNTQTPAEKLKPHVDAMKYREQQCREEINAAQVKLATTMNERMKLEDFIYKNFKEEAAP